MKSIEVSSKRVKDAIEEGLRQLGVTLSDVDVEILDPGGFLKKAVVRLTVTELGEEAKRIADEEKAREEKENANKPAPARNEEKKNNKSAKKKERGDRQAKEPIPKKRVIKEDTTPAPPASDELKTVAYDYLNKIVSLMGVEDAVIKVDGTEKVLECNVETQSGTVIGHRGETLYALEFLTGLAVNADREKFVKVKLDCNGYRIRREDSLAHLASRMADKAVRTGRKVTLEAMNSAQRRVIHSALSEDDRVVTKSEGKEPNRKVVIFPRG